MNDEGVGLAGPLSFFLRYGLFDQIWVSQALAERFADPTIDRRTKHGGDGSDHDLKAPLGPRFAVSCPRIHRVAEGTRDPRASRGSGSR